MKKIPFILTVISVLFVCSCQEQQQQAKKPEPASIEGLKIQDLLPKNKTRNLPAAVHMKLLTYVIEKDKFFRLRSIQDELSQNEIRFVNKNTFNVNGFETAFGKKTLWSYFAERLTAEDATLLGSNTIIAFDDKGDDIGINQIEGEQTIFYTQKAGSVSGMDIGWGTLSWRLKTKSSSRLPGVSEVRLVPVFKKGGSSNFSHALGIQNKDVIFRSAALATRMAAGDFLFVFPEKNINDMSLGHFFFLADNPHLVKFYVFGCVRVDFQ